MEYGQRSLVVLLLDEEGAGSPLADAVRRAGHRLVTATGIDTAVLVLGSLEPDVVLVRSTTPERDKSHLARLTREAPMIPTRVLAPEAPVASVLDDAPPLN